MQVHDTKARRAEYLFFCSIFYIEVGGHGGLSIWGRSIPMSAAVRFGWGGEEQQMMERLGAVLRTLLAVTSITRMMELDDNAAIASAIPRRNGHSEPRYDGTQRYDGTMGRMDFWCNVHFSHQLTVIEYGSRLCMHFF